VFLPRLCIERPVFATVLSLALLVFGVVGYVRLPVRELPDIEFPIVSVTTVLPGASPEVVETEITEILEEELNGIEAIDIIESVSSEQVSNITLQFDLDRDIDTAAEDVRDRVARVRGRLPDDAEEPLVAKFDVSAETIMWVAVFSPTRTPFEISNLSEKFVKPRLQTLPGVGAVRSGGSNEQAMRVEIDRNLLANYTLTVAEVVDALRAQNVEVPSGRVEGQWREFVVKTQGEFNTPEGFASIVLAYRGESPVRLGDVAKVRYGFEDERTTANYTGIRTTGLGIVKQSQANTLEVAEAVKAALDEIRPRLPDGFDLQIAFDQSPFIADAVNEVRDAMLTAGILVVFVIFVFLQGFRSTLIPSVAIPVSVITTFGVIYFLGFTINNLVLMALTLVIGVVVDDAIIVLENAYRHMENGENRYDAAIAASNEIAFAVIATTLTLVAVFVPIAFLGGTVGRLFYEFGITVAVSICVSAFVALTLTPMLCSRMLSLGTSASRKDVVGKLAQSFDRALEGLSVRYERALTTALRHRIWTVVLVVATVALSVLFFFGVGKEFLPQDDRGYFMVSVKTPEGSTMAYQERYQNRVERLLDATEEVRSYFSIVAIGRGGPGRVNEGIMFVRMHPRSERQRSAAEVLGKLRAQAKDIPGADVFFFQFNPLQPSSGSKPLGFVVQHSDFDTLAQYSARLRDAVEKIPGLADVDTNLEVNKPQLDVRISRDKANSLGISASDIADTLRVLLGGDDVTTYKRGNDRYDVIVQLQARDRLRPSDLSAIYVRTSGGQSVPLSNVVEVRETVGPSAVNHYNRRRSVEVDGNLAGIDLGHAIAAVSAEAERVLPEGFTTTLSGESREHVRGSRGLGFTFVLALVAIYLVLAAQFESFVHPFTIMLALPLATFGALAGLYVFGMNLSVYGYIGLIMLMGLVTKNSILLVDYANQQCEGGATIRDAMLGAARTRLRPIMMTAVSTIFGVLPIALGFGAGAEGRRPLGVAVVVGMTTSTVLTLVVVPVVYTLLSDAGAWLRARRERIPPAPELDRSAVSRERNL
jgi:multidrug efflux pump